MMTFDERKITVAYNLYNSIIENYHPVPAWVFEEKDFLIEVLKNAWIDGANWRAKQLEFRDDK